MSKELFTGKPARSKLAHNQENELHALLTFNPPAVEADERPSLDVGVVLDHSGSMGGQKIDYAKQSLLKLVEHLKPDDTLSVVIFDSTVDVVFETTKMDEEGRRMANERIRQIQANSATNLSGGLFKGLDFLKAIKKEDGRVRKCLLFTDGLANNGITEPEKLREAALEYRSGIGISTFGYGSDHDAKLLEALAQDGSFYYIDSPDKILQAFGAELGGLISTYAQNVEIRLHPADGVKIDEVLNDLTVEPDGGQTPGTDASQDLIVHADDLLAEIPYHICLKLSCEKRVKGPGPREVALVHATAKFTNVVEKRPDELTASIKARFVKPDEADTDDDEEVMREVAVFTVVRAQVEAMKLADLGDFSGAGVLLQDAANAARGYGNETMGLVADDMVVACSSQASYTSGGRERNIGTKGLLSRRRVGGAMGQSVGGMGPEVLYASLGASNAVMDSMQANFGGGGTGDAPATPPQSQTGAPMAPELGSKPKVRDPSDKKKAKSKKSKKGSTAAKRRSNRW